MTDHIVTIGLQILPKSDKKSSYSLIDVAIDVIKASGVKHLVTPFETVMEGKYRDLMDIAENAQKAVLDAGALECLVYYRIQYRKHEDVVFDEKNLDR